MLRFARPFYPFVLALTGNNPERGHRRLLQTLTAIDQAHRNGVSWPREQLQQTFTYHDPRLQQTCWGLTFPTVLGLAAGCDKDGEGAALWSALGFGFAELGAVTQHPQPGNPQPRLFRLSQDQAVLNRLGANNQGALALQQRLAKTWSYYPRENPIGINLCKSKVTPLAAAANDYVASFQALKTVADYFVVNVSSPNTPGLRDLQAATELAPIFSALQAGNDQQQPILVKIAPDLSWEAITTIVELVQEYQLAGIVATNTTIRRDQLRTQTLPQTGQAIATEAGGISGMPLRQRSTEVIRFVYQQTQGKIPIIGVGGIFTAEDAWEKILAGASLLQFYTGWIYGGPWSVPTILKGLSQKLDQYQLNHIQQAVGAMEAVNQ